MILVQYLLVCTTNYNKIKEAKTLYMSFPLCSHNSALQTDRNIEDRFNKLECKCRSERATVTDEANHIPASPKGQTRKKERKSEWTQRKINTSYMNLHLYMTSVFYISLMLALLVV